MNIDDLHYVILRHRGGCRCGDPDARPPCWNCESEWKLREIYDGLAELEGQGTDDELLALQAELVTEKFVTRAEMLEIQQRLIDEA